ncbi:PucR family transcriptional regulator [Microbacterium suwonense]|uniref:PucR C-terminal helix-turn-helix domain-containing protein n=1 Tax=Microbacterium suwonense TaxID=683047 RepID=A0ABN6X779_9MICO|nr:PucR family transcriptional regulator [Microbacterium suwonense]BDZ40655.1 hypothetical protein GCM10025863_32690 [Microbacterium suwonense]
MRRGRTPLFEVPYLTPFIAIARAHAEAIAARTYARRTWALEAQRALAIAALRPRPLESTLTELARRLGHWVGMFDAAGALAHEHPAGRVPADRIGELSVRTIELAARGDQAGDSLTAGPDSFALFTLGPTGNLRGTIAVATATLDAEARAVVTSAIAMTGLTLQQNEQLARDRRRLRSELLVTLRRDDPALARTVLGSLPQAPVLVAVAEHGAPADAITQFGDRLRSLSGSRVFDAEAPEGLTICVSNADAGMLDAIAERFGIRLGVSEPAGYDAFSHAHRQAVVALRHGRAGAAHYAATADSSILSALSGDEARLIAEARLAPLRAQEGLIQTLRVWLEHDARFESAARDLGIHRHTLRARVAQASRLLGTDLGTFPARAELWAALLAAG